MSGDAALGPRRFDFRSIDPLDFEELCFALVRLEFPAAMRVAAPDKGVDVLVPAAGRELARGFQAKRYVDQIAWPECRKSLDAAADGHMVGRLTFCFARDLTAKQLLLFDKHLRARRRGISVDWWGASELTARMADTEEGRLVAARFFGDPARDAEAIARAIRAGGAIRTADHVLERQLAIGEFATRSDPFFSYETAQHEVGAATREPAPGTAVRVEWLRDGIVSRIDAAPRSREALERFGPRGRLIFQGTEHGTRAHEELTRVVREGGSATLERGVTVAFDALPPLLAQLTRLGEEFDATVRVEAKTRELAVIARAARDDGSVLELPLVLRLQPKPRPDEIELQGHHGGLTMTLIIAAPDGHRESRMHWHYRVDDSPARDQLAALRLLQAATHGAQFELVTAGDRRVVIAGTAAADEGPDWLDQLTALVRAIVTLEKISGETIPIPTEIEGSEANSIVEVAAMFNAGGVAATWDDLKLVARPEILPQLSVGRNLRVVEQVYVQVLGRQIHVGEREITLERFRITKTEPVGEGPDGDLRITCVPVPGDDRRIFMLLRPAVQRDVTRA